MSTETQEPLEMATKPITEHHWLHQLVGEWKVENEMMMPDGSTFKSHGSETVVSLGGLWAAGEGKGMMPDGSEMDYRVGLGYDVSFKEYAGFMIFSASSHLWKYRGKLSADGRVMTLDCVGPDMETDGETANYRDVIEIVNDNHRTLTSYGQDKKSGEWRKWMKASYTRI